MSNASVIEDNPVLARRKELTFELTNRADSQWVKKGTERSNNPKHLNAPKDYFLPMKSRIWDKKLGRYVSTQYIPGANTIYVDDRSVVAPGGEVIIEKGLKSQGYDLKDGYRQATDLGVKFEFGLLFLEKYGGDSLLLEFVNTHEDNVEAKLESEKRDPRKLTIFNFRPLRKEVKAQKRLDNFEVELEAITFVGKLRKSEGGVFVYNKPMLNALLKIVDEGAGLGPDDDYQKMEILVRCAKVNGPGFMEMVKEVFDEYKMTISLATNFEILTFGSKDVKLKIGESAPRVLITSKKSEKEEVIEDLIMHFLGSDGGKNDYNLMAEAVEVAKVTSMQKKK